MRLLASLGLLCWLAAPLSAAERVVSIAPFLTDMVLQLAARSQLVGVLDDGQLSGELDKVARVGSYGTLSAERIVATKPDLVLAWSSGSPAELLARLRSWNIQVAEFDPQRLDDIDDMTLQLGELLDRKAQAAALAGSFNSQLDQLRAQPGEFTLVAPKDKQHGMVTRQRPRQMISRQPQNAGLLGLVHRIDEVTTVPKIRFDRVNPDAHQTLDGCSGVDLAGQGGRRSRTEKVCINQRSAVFADKGECDAQLVAEGLYFPTGLARIRDDGHATLEERQNVVADDQEAEIIVAEQCPVEVCYENSWHSGIPAVSSDRFLSFATHQNPSIARKVKCLILHGDGANFAARGVRPAACH